MNTKQPEQWRARSICTAPRERANVSRIYNGSFTIIIRSHGMERLFDMGRNAESGVSVQLIVFALQMGRICEMSRNKFNF